MKTFQKIALVSAIAAAPFAAQADLTPMDDSLMGNTTGQAGVTIEIDLGTDGIGIGSVVYTDTDTDGALSLENINVGLTGTLVQTIDVGANGDLEMTMSSPGTLSISAGDDGTGAFSALKLVGAAGTGEQNDSEIINNLSLDVALGTSTTTIKNLGTAASNGLGTLGANGLVDVGSTYADVKSSMAIQMTASANISNLNVGLFGYTSAQAGEVAGDKAAAYAAGYQQALAADGGTAGTNANGFAGAYAVDADNNGVIEGAELTALESSVASGSAVEVTNVTISQAGSNGTGMFSVDQVIWAVGGDAKLPGSDAGVYIQMGAMDLDINVEGIAIGGSSIGSLAVNGLSMNGLTQRIYGH